jgi:transcriptional regulator with XRE-family HTH domain
MTLGQILRSRRESKGLLLRQAAASLDIDSAILSKYERDFRLPKKEQLVKFANYYALDEDELIVAWLSDKIVQEIADEKHAHAALDLARKKIDQLIRNKND